MSNIVHFGVARKSHKSARHTELAKHLVFWPVIVVVLVFATLGSISAKGQPRLDAVQPVSTIENGQSVVTLTPDKLGHYVFLGSINGQPVKFLLDTGATGVSVPQALSKYLGLSAGKEMQTTTANGKSLSYRTTITSVSVGNITLDNVSGGLSGGLENDVILLGMSFLKHVDMIQTKNQLVLKYQS